MSFRLKFWGGWGKKRLPQEVDPANGAVEAKTDLQIAPVQPTQLLERYQTAIHSPDVARNLQTIEGIRTMVGTLVALDLEIDTKVRDLLLKLLPEMEKELRSVEDEIRKAQKEIDGLQEDADRSLLTEVKDHCALIIEGHTNNIHLLRKAGLVIIAKLFAVVSIQKAIEELQKLKEDAVNRAKQSMSQLERLEQRRQTLAQSTARVNQIVSFATTGISTQIAEVSPELVALVDKLVGVFSQETLRYAEMIFHEVDVHDAGIAVEAAVRQGLKIEDQQMEIARRVGTVQHIESAIAALASNEEIVGVEKWGDQVREANRAVHTAVSKLRQERVISNCPLTQKLWLLAKGTKTKLPAPDVIAEATEAIRDYGIVPLEFVENDSFKTIFSELVDANPQFANFVLSMPLEKGVMQRLIGWGYFSGYFRLNAATRHFRNPSEPLETPEILGAITHFLARETKIGLSDREGRSEERTQRIAQKVLAVARSSAPESDFLMLLTER